MGARDARSEPSERGPVPLPKRLGKAMRVGIGRLLPSTRALRYDTARPSTPSQDRILQGRKFISYNELPGMPSETRHQETTTEGPQGNASRHLEKPASQWQYAVPAAEGSALPSTSHAKGYEEAERNATEPEPSERDPNLLGTPAGKGTQPKAHSLLSSLQLDATADAITRAEELRAGASHRWGCPTPLEVGRRAQQPEAKNSNTCLPFDGSVSDYLWFGNSS